MGRQKLGPAKKRFKVMRVGVENYGRLKIIRDDIRAELDVTRLSFDRVFDELIAEREVSAFYPPMFLVNGKIFHEVEAAKGHAIVESLKAGADVIIQNIKVVGFEDF